MPNQNLLQELTIIIPAYNESDCLPSFLPNVIKYCTVNNWQLIVVDDGSEDNTAQILDGFSETPCYRVIRHKLNRGYGAALKTGISESKTELVVTIDADGQHIPTEIEKLFDTLKSTDADLVVGNRLGSRGDSPYRSLGKWLIRSISKILMSLPIYDLNSGMKLYRTDLAKSYLELCPDSMAFSDVITLIFIHQRRRVVEVPIAIKQRLGGESTINTRTAFETFMAILHIVTLCNPMRIFLPAAIFWVCAGVLWGLPIIWQGRGVSVGATLSILIGLMFFFLGLIAEQISATSLERVRANRII